MLRVAGCSRVAGEWRGSWMLSVAGCNRVVGEVAGCQGLQGQQGG
jgi:hypothetical protein